MDIIEAHREIEGFGRECGIRNLWETLKAVEMCWDDLSIYTKQAYRTVKNELEKEMTNGN
jgi:hypothetical protein